MLSLSKEVNTREKKKLLNSHNNFDMRTSGLKVTMNTFGQEMEKRSVGVNIERDRFICWAYLIHVPAHA